MKESPRGCDGREKEWLLHTSSAMNGEAKYKSKFETQSWNPYIHARWRGVAFEKELARASTTPNREEETDKSSLIVSRRKIRTAKEWFARTAECNGVQPSKSIASLEAPIHIKMTASNTEFIESQIQDRVYHPSHVYSSLNRIWISVVFLYMKNLGNGGGENNRGSIERGM